MGNNKTLLVVVVLLLLGIFGVLVMDRGGFNFGHKDTIGENIDEAVEEIGDEIDDHTTAR